MKKTHLLALLLSLVSPVFSTVSQADEIRNAAGGKCLDVAGGNPAAGTRIILWPCHGGPNQNWTVTKGEIRGLGGKCLDIAGGNPAAGTPIILWPCHGGPNQRWTVTKEGQIRGLGGKCSATVTGRMPADGTPITLSSCNREFNQKWSFMKQSAHEGPTKFD